MKVKVILITVLASLVCIIAGAMLGMVLTATSFYHIYGPNQSPYDVQERYAACMEGAQPGQDCLLIPMTVNVQDMNYDAR